MPSARASGASRGTSTPPPPVFSTSGRAPLALATTGVPQAMASAAGSPKPS